MNREKVIELAREARLAEPTHPFNPWGASDDALERFAALIAAEVRGDAEPVLWLYDFFADGEEFCNWLTKSLEEVGACHNVRPLYLHPAPTVDAEPVAYETDKQLWAADDPDINDWIRQNGRPLFAHPTPAVVQQLAEAVERLREKAKWINDEQAIVGYEEMMEVKSALAAAKDAGL